MTPDVLLGLVLGGGLGATNAAASYGLYQLVRDRSDRTFYQVVLLGMLARMGTALALVALVLALVPVHFFAFIGALLATASAGLVLEVVLVHRGGPAHAQQPHPPTSL